MADPLHVEWLKEGVAAWDEQRRANDFRPNLEGANLRETDLTGAGLEGAYLEGADLTGTDLGGAIVKTVKTVSTINNEFETVFTDFSRVRELTYRQIATMIGDTGVILPDDMTHPADWPVWRDGQEDEGSTPTPDLPDEIHFADAIDDSDGRLKIAGVGDAPDRQDLAGLFTDLRSDVEDLDSVGYLSNTSPALAKALDRFLETIPEKYENLEQVRFAVAVKKMHLIFATAREDLVNSAPDKVGFIEAVLYAADLLKARLPEWASFLTENEGARKQISEDLAAFEEISTEAVEGLKAAPEHFDQSLFERMVEYIDGKTIEGYLAAKDLLVNVAHKVFSFGRDLAKDVLSESRTLVVQGIAGTFLAELGAVCLKLVGLLPAELSWMVRWLKYLPTL